MDSQFTISSIVFIVCLIVPGLFFKRFYFCGQFTKQFGAGLFADRIITSIFWGGIVQIITLIIYSKTFNFNVKNLSISINNAYSIITANHIPEINNSDLIYALGYLSSSLIIASILGAFFHKLIRLLKIDVKFEVFRFSNSWNYYFRGEILAANDFKSSTTRQKGKVLSTIVDVVIDDGNDVKKMISGFLSQYTISSKTGELETLYLTEPKRYSLTESKFKEIPSDCYIIPYNRVLDLNVRYNIMQTNDFNLKIITNIISVIGLIGFLAIFAFPWFFSELPVYKKLFSIAFFFITWILLIALALDFFSTTIERKLDIKAHILGVVLATVSGLTGLWILNIIDFILILKNQLNVSF